MNVIGEVEGKTCVVVDDIIDTAGTLVKTAEVLHDRGAARVLAAGVHPVLSGPSVRADRGVRPRAGHRHRHDSAAASSARACREDPPALGGRAARRGDPAHSRGQVGIEPVRLEPAARRLRVTRSFGADSPLWYILRSRGGIAAWHGGRRPWKSSSSRWSARAPLARVRTGSCGSRG